MCARILRGINENIRAMVGILEFKEFVDYPSVLTKWRQSEKIRNW